MWELHGSELQCYLSVMLRAKLVGAFCVSLSHFRKQLNANAFYVRTSFQWYGTPQGSGDLAHVTLAQKIVPSAWPPSCELPYALYLLVNNMINLDRTRLKLSCLIRSNNTLGGSPAYLRHLNDGGYAEGGCGRFCLQHLSNSLYWDNSASRQKIKFN